jgi:protein disulfide-isomerase A6
LILVFPKGSETKEPVAYEEGRSEQDFVGYLNEKAGTHRVAGGGLTDSAGRIVDLDALAGKLSAAVSEMEKSSL